MTILITLAAIILASFLSLFFSEVYRRKWHAAFDASVRNPYRPNLEQQHKALEYQRLTNILAGFGLPALIILAAIATVTQSR